MESIRATISCYPIGEKRKKVLIFSPHPDDDVICMAGTLKKLIEQGHDMSVCY